MEGIAGFDVGYGAAALAGLLSFLSPCILPIVPFYLCYLAGISFETLSDEGRVTGSTRRRVVLSAVLFALGVTTIFVGLGASASLFGQWLRDSFDILRYVAAAIILLMGLHFLGVLKIGLFNRQARMDVGEHQMGLLGAYVVGLAFAFGWSPCAGPLLGVILFKASAAQTAGEGALLLLVYSLGMTLPFVLAALFVGPFLSWAKGFRKYMGTVEKVMGAFLILFAVLIGTDSIRFIAEWMVEYGPDLGTTQ
ncbi:MAG: cytochrome c biogenesis protein CcdA [Neomegalonema sp.]|nr:cytochrome c biogenesis protein CcdA [Neomegalonema sp.]